MCIRSCDIALALHRCHLNGWSQEFRDPFVAAKVWFWIFPWSTVRSCLFLIYLSVCAETLDVALAGLCLSGFGESREGSAVRSALVCLVCFWRGETSGKAGQRVHAGSIKVNTHCIARSSRPQNARDWEFGYQAHRLIMNKTVADVFERQMNLKFLTVTWLQGWNSGARQH